MIQHCAGIYASFKINLISEISIRYGVKLNSGTRENDIWLSLLGIRQHADVKDEKLDKLLNKITLHPIEDSTTIGLVSNFFKNIENQKYMLVLFLEGYASHNEVSNFQQFFRGDVNKVIRFLVNNNRNASLLAEDIAKSLLFSKKLIYSKPSIKNLNDLWNSDLFNQSSINQYMKVLWFLLKQVSAKDIIDKTILSLSTYYLDRLLGVFQINNKEGIYNFSDFKKDNSDSLIDWK